LWTLAPLPGLLRQPLDFFPNRIIGPAFEICNTSIGDISTFRALFLNDN